MINIEKIKVDVANRGHITNSYIIYDDTKTGILVDPGYDSTKIISTIVNLEVDIKYIVITHGHGDHIGALEAVYNYTKAPIIVHEKDLDMLLGKVENYSEIQGVEAQNLENCNVLAIKDGYTFRVGYLNCEVIHTPGHTAGSFCLLEKTTNTLFTGDTVFYDCYGRCDLLTGSFDDMIKSLTKLFNRFDDIVIYPGHGKSIELKRAKKYIKILLSMKDVHID